MEFRILGPLEVVSDAGPLPLPEGRARSLVAILALHPRQVVSTDLLIDRLWGATPPPTARTKLYGLVSTLRKALAADSSAAGRALISTRAPGYALAVDPDQVDAFHFRRLVGEATELPPAEKARVLREALALWRGTALADFTYEPFAQTDISSLEEIRLTAVADRIDAELDLGLHVALVPELEALVAENPFRERLRAQAMLALYRAGNQRRALAVYRDGYELFAEELGLEPGLELQKLEEAILNHDPTLQPPAAPPSRPEEDPDPEGRVGRWLGESRRIVTVAYIDLRMPDGAGRDLESHRDQARLAYGRIIDTLRRHGGSSQGSIGGVNVAIFGIPAAHEDDPLRAVRAALEVMEDFGASSPIEERQPLARIGVNTGEVLAGGVEMVEPGLPEDTVRLTARLQQSAQVGEILIGDRTRQLVSHAVIVEPVARSVFDDAGQPVTAWRVVKAVPSSPTAAPPDTPMVGREPELGRILAAFDQVVETGSPRRLNILGPAGIGKSRLAAEFARSVSDRARVLTGHCPPYGEGITFWPLREIVEAAAGSTRRDEVARLMETVGDEALDPVLGAIGTDAEPPRPHILFPSLRTFLEALAHDQPVALVLEDLHWAQPTFLDLLDYATEFVEAPVLLLGLARPELREQGRLEEGERSTTLILDPLGTEHVEALVDLTLSRHAIPHDRAREAAHIAEGNPLFIRQMLVALREHEALAIPPSIHGLLLARLDRLGPAEQDTIRAASVLGRRFEFDELRKLLPERAHRSVSSHLEALERKELISREGEDQTFSFRHALIQLVSYRTLTKHARAELHEQVAELLDSSADGDVTKIEELAGYHLDRAVGYRRELVLDDSHTSRLAENAGERLGRAGLRAFRRFDVMAAEKLLARADDLLPDKHPDRWAVSRTLAEADQVMGRHAKAIEVLDRLIEGATEAGDETLKHFLRLERAWAHIAKGPDPVSLEEIKGETERAREVFAAAGDETGLAQVCRVMLHLHHRRGEMAEMEEMGCRGVDHAFRSPSTREQLGAQWLLAIALEEGPRPAGECIGRCDQIRRSGDIDNPGVVSAIGYFWAMAGEFDQARRLAGEARRILRERVRARRPLGHVIRREGDIYLLSGELEAGVSTLHEALTLNREMGERDAVAQIAAALARLESRRGQPAQAARLAAMSRRHAPSQSVTSQALWRSARARIVSRRGQAEEATALAEAALRLVPPEMLNLRADVMVDLGEVLIHSGRHDAGHEAIGEAIGLYRQKGNLAAAAQAATLIES